MKPTKIKGKARGPRPSGASQPETAAQKAVTALDVFSRATSGVRQLILVAASAIPKGQMPAELTERLSEIADEEATYQRRRGEWLDTESVGSVGRTSGRGKSRKCETTSSPFDPTTAP